MFFLCRDYGAPLGKKQFILNALLIGSIYVGVTVMLDSVNRDYIYAIGLSTAIEFVVIP